MIKIELSEEQSIDVILKCLKNLKPAQMPVVNKGRACIELNNREKDLWRPFATVDLEELIAHWTRPGFLFEEYRGVKKFAESISRIQKSLQKCLSDWPQ